MAQAAKKALAWWGIIRSIWSVVMPRRANLRISESVAKYAGVPMDKVFLTVDGYGNMSAATVPVALEFVNAIRARRGSRGASELRLMAPRFAETGLLPGIGSYGK